MGKILIGNKIISKNPTKKLIRCCSCHKYYDFKGNIFSNTKYNILICPHCGLKHKIDFKLFKDKIGNLIKINGFNLGAIDIGGPVINRAGAWGAGKTLIVKNNPANASGEITEVEIWVNSAISDCEIATFFVVSGNNLSTRGTHYVGSLSANTKHVISELHLTVEGGDYIGIYFPSGSIEFDIPDPNGIGMWYKTGDYISCINTTFIFDDLAISIGGIGMTLPKNATGKADFSTSMISVLSRGKIESATAKASLISNIIGILLRGKMENVSGKVDITSNIISILSRIRKANAKASINTLIDSILSRGQIENVNGKSDLSTSFIVAFSRGIIESVSGESSVISTINITLSRGKIENVNGKADIVSDIIISLNRGMIEDVSGITSITTLIDILLSKIKNASGNSQFDTDIDTILNRIISINGKAILDTLFDVTLDRTEILHVNGKSYIYISFNVNLISGKRALGKTDIDSLIDISLRKISKRSGKSIFDTLIEVEISRQLIFTQATLGIESTQATLGIESTQATLGIER